MLFASGCAKPAVAPKRDYQGSIVLWVSQGLAGYPAPGFKASWFEERAGAYASKHHNVKVEIQVFASPQELEKAVQTAAAGSRPAPDLLFGRPLPDLQAGLDNVAGLLGTDGSGYLSGGLDAFRKGDQQFGVPALLEVQALALNEQTFATAGVPLPAGGRWTREEFETTLSKLSRNGNFGIGFYHLPGYHEWWPLASGVIRQDGSIAGDAEAGLGRLVKYRRQGFLHPDTGKLKAEETWALFAKGAFAIMPVSAWAIAPLRDMGVKFTLAAFPGDVTTGYTYGFSFFRQSDPAKLQAAWDVAQFIAAPDQQVRIARDTGLLPASKSAGNPFEGDPQFSRLLPLAAGQKPLPAGPAWDKAEASVSRELLYVLLDSRSAAAGLEQIKLLSNSATTPAKQ